MRFLYFFAGLFLFVSITANAQNKPASQWADSVFNSLTDDERIAQLLVVRSSNMDGKGGGILYDKLIDTLVEKYNIGAICAFQGTPLQHAAMFNRMNAVAKTPIMVTVDGEWGLGMRFGGVQSFPFQLTMGALPDAELVYEVGRAIGDQCRRMNIHVNYAPVVDINNNPANPVIGIRSFGEDKYKVALMGTRIMEGMQDRGVMACAKHFPGHGDVSVDSHHDLPVIYKSLAQLDSMEFFPFRQLFKKGVGSVMVAHLWIPAIDSTPNRATSLSPSNITGLMRNQMGYQGLTFTDALEMKGVAKFFPGGEAAVQSLIAGNDMLCLPSNVPLTIEAIKQAVAEGRLSWELVYEKCKRVLVEKYMYVNGKTSPIDTNGLTEDLNAQIPALRKKVAENSLTVLGLETGFFPLPVFEPRAMVAPVVTPAVTTPTKKSAKSKKKAKAPELEPEPAEEPKLLYLAYGASGKNELGLALNKSLGAQVRGLPFNQPELLTKLKKEKLDRHEKIVIGLHGAGRYPAKNYGIPTEVISSIKAIQAKYPQTILLVFGNPYIISNFPEAKNLVVCYEDDAIFQQAAADWMLGKFPAVGSLPVSVGKYPFGTGLVQKKGLQQANPASTGMRPEKLNEIDSVAAEAIAAKATPGCVVTVLHKGQMVFQKAYGHTTYEQQMPVKINAIYDLASVTKTSATTMAIMHLYETGKIDLKSPIGDYLPALKGSDKEGLTVENLLLHQAGLNPFIPFYKEITDTRGNPLPAWLSTTKGGDFNTDVTESLYVKDSWKDSMFERIKSSSLLKGDPKYVYSDNDFILLGKIAEAVSGLTLDKLVRKVFYEPMDMASTRFLAFNHFPATAIAPTENEKNFRQGQLWGYVHDPGAALFGNVAGHAGLFSNATDLAKLYQMMLNGGVYEGRRYLKAETIEKFTAYQSPLSRRGLGFDKPEKNNDFLPLDKTYPSSLASFSTYGHTGYTGTCVWVDPAHELVYIFLSNRVYPDGGTNTLLSKLNIRSRIQDIIYEALL